jgi:uncharacterized protein (UPF0216 family)
MLSEAEAEIEWAELEKLEDMVRRLTMAALKLPPGVDRRDSLMIIGSFGDRIAAMKQTEVNRASIMQTQQFERTG